jgi:hypothetical protein
MPKRCTSVSRPLRVKGIAIWGSIFCCLRSPWGRSDSFGARRRAVGQRNKCFKNRGETETFETIKTICSRWPPVMQRVSQLDQSISATRARRGRVKGSLRLLPPRGRRYVSLGFSFSLVMHLHRLLRRALRAATSTSTTSPLPQLRPPPSPQARPGGRLCRTVGLACGPSLPEPLSTQSRIIPNHDPQIGTPCLPTAEPRKNNSKAIKSCWKWGERRGD